MEILGVDGCHFGWLMVKISTNVDIFELNKPIKDIINHSNIHIEKYHNFFELNRDNPNFNICLIDIPIGMIKGGKIPRKADSSGRDYLKKVGGKTSSIFPTPCRKALYAVDYLEANKINREITGKGISKQTWNITDKIRDLDEFLQNRKEYVDKIFESGPELCFARINEDKAITESKKTEIGVKKRLELMNEIDEKFVELYMKAKEKFLKKNVKNDDILDAMILSISGIKGPKKLEILPKFFEYDEKELPMRIVLPKFNN